MTNFFKLIHPVIKVHIAWAVAKLFPELRGAAKYVIDLCAIVRIEDEKLLCDKFGMFYFNIIEHILFSCDLIVELREDLWRDIININTIDFSMYMDSLTSLEFITELLSCDTKYELDNDASMPFSKCCVFHVNKICKLFHR